MRIFMLSDIDTLTLCDFWSLAPYYRLRLGVQSFGIRPILRLAEAGPSLDKWEQFTGCRISPADRARFRAAVYLRLARSNIAVTRFNSFLVLVLIVCGASRVFAQQPTEIYNGRE